jgi:hypothetical protein
LRRLYIQQILPLLFSLLPVLAAVLIALAVPREAMADYWQRMRHNPMDWLILGLGGTLFLIQVRLTYRALKWSGDSFNESPDRWLNHLASAAEWFPLLGLIGTVAAILQTFSSIGAPGATAADTMPKEIIRKYAPAITATGSGLFMALLNILPTWIVMLGRDIIRSLAGVPHSSKEERA